MRFAWNFFWWDLSRFRYESWHFQSCLEAATFTMLVCFCKIAYTANVFHLQFSTFPTLFNINHLLSNPDWPNLTGFWTQYFAFFHFWRKSVKRKSVHFGVFFFLSSVKRKSVHFSRERQILRRRFLRLNCVRFTSLVPMHYLFTKSVFFSLYCLT